MSGSLLFARAGQALQRLLPMQLLKRPRIRISFDIDDTLACQLHHCDVEPSRLPACEPTRKPRWRRAFRRPTVGGGLAPAAILNRFVGALLHGMQAEHIAFGVND